MDYKDKKYRSLATAFMVFSLIAAVALAAFRTWLIVDYYDVSSGFYKGAGIFETVFYAVEYGLVVLALISAFVFIKKISIEQPEPSSGSVFAGIFCGFVLLASVALFFLENKSFVDANTLAKISLIALIPSSLYFILGMASKKIGYTVKVILCFCVILWAMTGLLALYFETTLVMNNPAKVTEQLVFIAVMIYFLFECRFFIDKARPSAYLAVGFASVMLISVSVIPNIISAFVMNLSLTTSLYSQIAEFGILVYIIFRTFSNIGNITAKGAVIEEQVTDAKSDK